MCCILLDDCVGERGGETVGELLDGDQLLYIIAQHSQTQGTLNGGVVGTLMTNLALEHKLASLNIPFERANVGDRYVLELLKKNNWQLGGENSGHILTMNLHTSGDAIIAALQVLMACISEQKSLTDYKKEIPLYPQVLLNVVVKEKIDIKSNSILNTAIQDAEATLSGKGRVLLRASGTEPKIRVMVEGIDATLVESTAKRLVEVVKEISN